MSKKVSTKIFSAIMVTALAVSANVSGYMGGFDDDRAHVNLNVGSKMISPEDKWGNDVKDMKSQTQFGIDFDYKLDVLPFNIAAGYFASSSEKGIATLSLSEIRLGVRKYQDFDAFSIYYGGGLSSVTAKLEYDKDLKTAAVLGQTLAEQQAEAVRAYKLAAKAQLLLVSNSQEKTALNDAIDAVADDDNGYTALQTIVNNLAAGTEQNGVTLTDNNDQSLFSNLSSSTDLTYQALVAIDAADAVYSEAASDTASTLGFYGELGGLYNVTEAIYVGANLTYTSATVEFETTAQKEKMDVSGAQIGLVVGYAF